MKVYTTADDTGLIWTDPDAFKRFAIGPLLAGLSPDERKAAFKDYMKMSADDIVNHRDTAGSYEVFDSDDVDEYGNSFDIDDKNFYKNMSLRGLYDGLEGDPFDKDLYDLLESKVEEDVNGDGDTDITVEETPNGTALKVEAEGDDEAEKANEKLRDKLTPEQKKLEDLAQDEFDEDVDNEALADKADKAADGQIKKETDKMVDDADAMADKAARELDSTGRLKEKDNLKAKLTPAQKKLEELAKRQSNITDTLAGLSRFY